MSLGDVGVKWQQRVFPLLFTFVKNYFKLENNKNARSVKGKWEISDGSPTSTSRRRKDDKPAILITLLYCHHEQ